MQQNFNGGPVVMQRADLSEIGWRLARAAGIFAMFVIALLCLVALATMAKAETLNELRSANGLRPLVLDGSVAAYAQRQAYAMAATGRKCSRRAAHDGTLFHNMDSSMTRAENVSCGCGNATCAIKQWIGSPPHRANILARWAGRYGIASARSSSGSMFWAMELRP